MVKISETDVKTNEQPKSKPAQSSHLLRGTILLLLTAAILGGGGWFLYQNPELIKLNSDTEKVDSHINQLHNKINDLQNKLAVIEADNAGKISGRELSALNERIDTHARLNREILDSKAGNNTILGLINRIDMLEIQVRNLGKVTNNNALILTAAMLVKDSAENGQSFEYEAEVLRQLADGTPMQTAAEQIAEVSSLGFPNKNQLINEFNGLYENLHLQTAPEVVDATPPEDNKTTDWKDKINEKLSKLVTVKYHAQDGEVIETEMPEDEVYVLVNEGKFDQAVLKMNNNPHYQSEEFTAWQKKIRAKDDFNRALRKIQAVTLAAMKVENLQNKSE